jgi:hypothetical protein
MAVHAVTDVGSCVRARQRIAVHGAGLHGKALIAVGLMRLRRIRDRRLSRKRCRLTLVLAHSSSREAHTLRVL